MNNMIRAKENLDRINWFKRRMENLLNPPIWHYIEQERDYIKRELAALINELPDLISMAEKSIEENKDDEN